MKTNNSLKRGGQIDIDITIINNQAIAEYKNYIIYITPTNKSGYSRVKITKVLNKIAFAEIIPTEITLRK